MKLSNAQQKVMDEAKETIDYARTHTLYEWAGGIESFAEDYKEYYENNRKGIVLTRCNSKTLEKLENLGLIEILYDSKNKKDGIDHVKVLNY